METLLLYWQLRIWGTLWQDCLAEVRARLEEAVQRLRLPKWPRAAADAWRPAAVLLARRFGKALRLMRAVAAFEGTLARGPLCALAIERLLPQVHSFHCFGLHCSCAKRHTIWSATQPPKLLFVGPMQMSSFSMHTCMAM